MTAHSSSFYNDFDPSASRWLDNLQRNNKIPKGVVSSMSITDIDEVGDYQYAHFFAGIGGWPLALQLAQLETDLKVWSGSCPCQPYSVAGKQKGINDERDLWPVFNRLINKERPDLIFGEQVASAIRHGWLDRLTCDLEDDGYLVLSAVLSANLLGAPHERRRLFWEPSNRISWRTPTVSDIHGGARWAIPRGALGTFKSTVKNAYLAANHFGRTESGLKVQKGKGFYLNPEVSRFVMGYPTDWSCYVATEMP